MSAVSLYAYVFIHPVTALHDKEPTKYLHVLNMAHRVKCVLNMAHRVKSVLNMAHRVKSVLNMEHSLSVLNTSHRL
jgi:ABC-type uncharacterized transport system ATPase subunit